MGRGLFLILLALAGACGTTAAKSRELQRVAKDWALTVRASQVIPVYPLTEDLQPGDVFLVSEGVEEQAREYEEKGFLALDHHLVRIPVPKESYASFYESWPPAAAPLPASWRAPVPPDRLHGWASARRAAFPSYTFSVQRGAGASVAIPVQGVPLGLSFLGSATATGSVTIADAYTYGLDDLSMRTVLEAWAGDHADYLANFASTEKAPRYLRVVTRVFLTGRVSIALTDGRAGSAGAAAGSPPEVTLPDAEHWEAAARGASVVDALNARVSDAAPGAALKVSWASRHAIAMDETFPRPLAIGYLGFDVPILEGGTLGSPVSTEAVLARGVEVPLRSFAYSAKNPLAAAIERWIGEDAARREIVASWLEAKGVGVSPTTWLRSAGAPGRVAQYRAFVDEHQVPVE